MQKTSSTGLIFLYAPIERAAELVSGSHTLIFNMTCELNPTFKATPFVHKESNRRIKVIYYAKFTYAK